MGTVYSAPIQTGGTTTLQGSSSYTYQVPMFHKPGRAGMDLDLTLYYNSHIWVVSGITMMGLDRNTPAPGFQLNFGYIEWNATTSDPAGTLSTPDGTKHVLDINLSDLVPNDSANTSFHCANQICLYDTTDSSYINVSRPMGTIDGTTCIGPNNCPSKDATVTYKNGTSAIYQSFALSAAPNLMRPYKITDPNGNIISITYLNANDLNISTITDSLGRTINFFYNSFQVAVPGQAAITIPLLSCITDGSSCSDPTARTFNFTYNTTQPFTFNFSSSVEFLIGTTFVSVQSGFPIPVLTQVCRPDLTCVKFGYGNWGIVNDIQEVSKTGLPRYELSYDFPDLSTALTKSPTYSHQFETVNGQTNTWTFTNTFNASGLITSSDIQDPTGGGETTYFSQNGDWQDGLPTQIVTLGMAIGTCHLCPPPKALLTRNITWASDLAMAQSGITNGGYNTGKNPRPASVTTILDDGSQSQATMQYDNSATPVAANAPGQFTGSGSVIDRIETDFGATAPGPTLRETVATYLLLSNHILGLPTDIKVKDATGKVFSHTVLTYDSSPVQPVSPLPSTGHDNTNYSATSTVSRGNLNSSTTYVDPVGNTQGITTSYTYDMLGNRINSTVGCCTNTAWSYSINTQYAYPDSIVIGPTGNQLTTNYTYDQNTGNVSTVTDPNGKITSYHYDVSGRLSSYTTPDNVTATINYDDSSANPGVSRSSTANSRVTGRTTDFLGHPISDQILNGTSPLSTVSYINDGRGRPLQVSNPYKPSETPAYTVYQYDLLGRLVQTTPPPATTGGTQNPYLMSITGASTLFTDPAGMQRKEIRDGLGRLAQVIQPGPSGGAFATAALTLSGTEQSVTSTSASNGATSGTASISIGGTQDRTASVVTHAATPATVQVSIGGQDGTISTSTTSCTGVPPKQTCRTITSTVRDSGNIYVSVNAGGTVISWSTPYGGASSPSSLAGGLAQNFPANSVVQLAYTTGTNSFILTTVATGTAANSTTLTTSIASSCQDSVGDNTTTSCTQSWTITPSQNFSGGTNQVTSTVYDTGKVTVSITATNGTTYSKQSVYVQGSSPNSVAMDLFNQFNADSSVTAALRMTQPGTGGLPTNTLGFTTVATGANTNYALSVASATTDTTDFAANSTSFPITPSGATFTAGQNGTLYDQGTVTLTIGGFTTTTNPPTKQVSYGQGSNAASLAAQIASLVHSDLSFPVDASVVQGSNTINFTARVQGAASNSYVMKLAGASALSASFPTPSFVSPAVSSSMANGADQTFSMDPSVAIVTNYSYDPLGNVRQLNRNQQTQTYAYDGLGRRTSAATPETAGQPVTYTYTDFGAVATKTDPRTLPATSNHITTTYGYDSLNRIKTVTYNDLTPNITYTYNPPQSANNTGGRLANVSSSVETKAYQYDVMGRVTQCLETIGTNSYTVGYGYSLDGQISSINYPSGHSVSYGYDPVGRLQQISTPTQGILSINPLDYDASGTPLKISYGNGIIGQFGYNGQMQLTSLQYGAASASPLFALGYSYASAANNGQIQAITDNVDSTRSTSYQYDMLGRLQMAQTADQTSVNSWKLNFAYDSDGNRLEETPVGGSASMPSNFVAVDPTTNHIQSSGALYDTAGNMVSDGLNNYVFDARNRITSANPIPGLPGNPSNFAYGPNGELVTRNNTNYIYAASQVIAEYANAAAAGAPSAEYINFSGNQIANMIAGAVTFNYSDHLSTRLVTDLTGKPVRTYGHFPGGETLYQTGVASDFQFTTYRRDASSGLDYANARFYSSRIGRFVSADPLLGDNRYAYGSGDAINTVDSSGLFAICIGNACGPNCGIICINPGDLGGGQDTSCALCGESLGLPEGMKIAPESLDDILRQALGIPDCFSWIPDFCGFGFTKNGTVNCGAASPDKAGSDCFSKGKLSDVLKFEDIKFGTLGYALVPHCSDLPKGPYDGQPDTIENVSCKDGVDLNACLDALGAYEYFYRNRNAGSPSRPYVVMRGDPMLGGRARADTLCVKHNYQAPIGNK